MIDCEKEIRERDDIIDNLFIALQAVKNNQYADFMPLLERTIKERNELSDQLVRLQYNFDLISESYTKCNELTKHFKV